MPIYEYECKKCGYRFDVLQSFSEPPVRTCRNDGCRGRVRKVLSPPTVIYKGSGFYTTDYARKGGGNGEISKRSKDKEALGNFASSDNKTEGSTKNKN
ncbi:MAG: FmdB family zinc ribbon protein [Candidatus Zipacnadales bacterium]